MSDAGGTEFRIPVHLEDDGSFEQLAIELERLLERAFAQASQTFTKSASAAIRDIFSKRGGNPMADQFAAASKNADAMNADLRRMISLEKDLETRHRGLKALAGDAFNTDALTIYNRNLATLTRLVEEAGGDLSRLSGESRRAFAAVAQNARGASFAEIENFQNVNRAARTAANERVAQEQNATRLAIQESKERIVQAQLEGSRVVAETRAAGQRRVAMIQAFSKQIQIAESAVGAAFRGTASVLSATVSGIGRGLSGAAGLFRRSGDEIGAEMRDTANDVAFSSDRINRELTQGFSTSLDRRESVLRSSMTTQEKILRESVVRQSVTLSRFEQQISSGVLGAATGRSAAAGALGFGGIGAIAGGAGLAGLLTSGFTRFSDLQRLNTQFIALTGNAETAAAVMAEVKAFAKITPFDLVGVADLAKGFLAMGTAAEDVLPQVRTIADAVALTGGGTDELTRIQRAIGQVVSAGRLQGDELNQLAENLPGLNIRQILADQLTGGDTAALVAMQEAGELSADSFVTALMTGLGGDPRIAGAAEALSGTLKGRFDNLKEQFSDFGAALIGLVAKPVGAAFAAVNVGLQEVSAFIRGEDLSPFLNTLRDAAAGAAIAIGGLLVAKTAGEALKILAVGVKSLFTPLGLVVAVVGGVGAALKLLIDRSPAFALALEQTGAIIGAAFTIVKDVVGGAFSFIGEVTGTGIDSIGAFGDFLAEKLTGLNDVLFRFVGQRLRPILEGFVDWLRNTALPALGTAFGAVRDFVVNTVAPAIGTAIQGVITAAGAVRDFAVNTIAPALATAFRATADFVSGVLVPTVTDVARNIVDFALIAGPAIADFAVSVSEFARANDELFGIIGAGIAGFAIGGPLGAAIAAGIGAIVTNFESIAPIVQPAADAITGFIDTVRKSGFATAFVDIGGGIAESFGNLGRTLVRALDRAWGAVTDWFDDIDWVDLGKGALDLVEEFGRIIGSIATNPKVIKAVATIVGVIGGAAALVVIRFGEGLVRGISENLDDWVDRAFDGFGDLVSLVFRTAFNNIPQVLLGVLGGTVLISLARRLFTDAGTAGAQGFGAGLRNGLSAIRGPGGSVGGAFFGTGNAGFFSAMFGGQAAIQRSIRTLTVDTEKTLRTEIGRMSQVLTAAGRGSRIDVTPTVGLQGIQNVRNNIKREYDKLAAEIGPSGVAGLRVRTAVAGVMSSISTAFTGDLGARRGAQNIKTAFGTLATVAKEEAGNISRSAVAGIASGLAAFGSGFIAGKQGGGLTSILLGIGGGAAAGSVFGPWGAAAGAAIAGIGAAFGTHAGNIEKARQEIREYQDAIEGLRGAAREEAILGILKENLKDESEEVRQILDDLLDDAGVSIRDFAVALSRGGDVTADTLGNLLDDLGPNFAIVAEQLEKGQLSVEDFAKSIENNRGNMSFAGVAGSIGSELEAAGISIDDFIDLLDIVFDEGNEVGTAMRNAGLNADLFGEDADRARVKVSGLVDVISSAGSGSGAVAGFVDIMSSAGSAVTGVSDVASAASDAMIQFASDVVGGAVSGASGVQEAVDDVTLSAQLLERQVDRSNQKLDDLFGKGTVPTLQEAMNDLIISFESLNLEDLDLNITLDRAKFDNQVDTVVEEFNAGIRRGITDGVITGTPQIILERDRIINELRRQFTTDDLDTPDIDESILTEVEEEFIINATLGINEIVNSEELPTLIAQQLGDELIRNPITVPANVLLHPSITFDKSLARRNAEIRREAGNNAPQMGFAAIGDNGGFSADELGLPTQINIPIPVNVTPVVNLAATAGASTQEIGVSVMRSIAQGIAAAGGLLVTATAAAINAGLRTVAASYATFLSGGTSIGRALATGVASAAGPMITSIANAINFALRTVANSYTAFYNGGLNIGRALGAGVSTIGNSLALGVYNAINAALRIAGGSYTAWYGIGVNMGRALASGLAATINIIAQSAAAVVRSAIIAAQGVAKIKSPSEVFMEIGGFMGEGLALGIDGSISQVAASASAMAQEAVNMASAVDSAIRVQPVSSGTVAGIREASGGTASTVVNVSIGGNVYGDEAFDAKMDEAFNQLGQAVSARPRFARATG
jgi:tape measure domain-containing protein